MSPLAPGCEVALYLHESHQRSCGSRAVPRATFRAEFQPLSDPPAEGRDEPGGGGERLAAARSQPRLAISGSQLLVLQDDPSAASGLALQLLFREVVLGIHKGTGRPLLCLASEDPGEVWLLLVDGDLAAGKQALSRMGQGGAIRLDFAELYALKSEPVGIGSTASVLAVDELLHGGEFGGSTASSRAHEGTVGKVLKQDKVGIIPQKLHQEVSMLVSVQGHPNVVHFHGLFHSDTLGSWVMLMERCSGGDLHVALARCPFEEKQAREVLRSLLSALAHVHRCEIVHRDVKCENVLLSGDGRVALADFGIACHARDAREMRRHCGSPGYAAPELVSGLRYDAKVDCFGAGALLYALFAQVTPFAGKSMEAALQRTLKGRIDLGRSAFLSVSAPCKDLIRQLLARRPSQRLSAEGALTSAWIQRPFVALRARTNALCSDAETPQSPKGGAMGKFLWGRRRTGTASIISSDCGETTAGSRPLSSRAHTPGSRSAWDLEPSSPQPQLGGVRSRVLKLLGRKQGPLHVTVEGSVAKTLTFTRRGLQESVAEEEQAPGDKALAPVPGAMLLAAEAAEDMLSRSLSDASLSDEDPASPRHSRDCPQSFLSPLPKLPRMRRPRRGDFLRGVTD